ncbi:MAG TPA: hypothetical protein DEQ30_09435 [Porphyromonadaceae bacterium]|nr:hypothetical protein [Porphyromonadaceae bacterium]
MNRAVKKRFKIHRYFKDNNTKKHVYSENLYIFVVSVYEKHIDDIFLINYYLNIKQLWLLKQN